MQFRDKLNVCTIKKNQIKLYTYNYKTQSIQYVYHSIYK